MYSTRLLLLLLILLLLTPPCLARRLSIEEEALENIGVSEISGEVRGEEDPVEEGHPVHKMLPDPSRPELLTPLKCSACGAIVEHAIDLLRPVIARHLERQARARRNNNNNNNVKVERPKEYEMVPAFEKLCRQVARDYGLEVQYDVYPTLLFSKSSAVNRVRGSWMPHFLAATCEELLDEQEEVLTSTIFDVVEKEGLERNLAVVIREKICTKWKQSAEGCDAHGLPIDTRSYKTSDL